MTLKQICVIVLGTLTAVLLMVSEDWMTRFFGLMGMLGALGYLGLAVDQLARQAAEAARLRDAYDQLDQQAKLIIRTDLDLHRTQEELDRRLASLMALHHLGRSLQVSLRPEEIFSRLDPEVVTQFGFSKALLGGCSSFDTLTWHTLVGLPADAAEQVSQHLLRSGHLKTILSRPAPRTLTAATVSDPAERELLQLFGGGTVVVAGLIPQAGPAGCLLLAKPGASTQTQSDEELIAILANQLTAAVESSALFEETYAARQELERKVRERTHDLAQANAELTTLNNAKSTFVSSVSHELRTPLAAIKGYASLLASGQFGKLSGAQEERVKKIEKHADLLTQLINNLLDIARIESGRVTMERAALPVEELFATIHEQVRPQLDAKHIRYAADLDGVRELPGDPQHLPRVFVNLLSNAVKYTPDGGAIDVRLRRDGASVVIVVRDSGCGIPAADLPKLFQEFYRALDPINQQVQGTGLGLALVKRIIEAHHGATAIASTPGQGTTVTVTLPAA